MGYLEQELVFAVALANFIEQADKDFKGMGSASLISQVRDLQNWQMDCSDCT